jgi:hypothetical protein
LKQTKFRPQYCLPTTCIPIPRCNKKGRGRGRGKGVSVQKYSNSLKGSVINSKVNMTNGGTGNNNSNAEKSVVTHGGRGGRGRGGRGRGRGRGRGKGLSIQKYSNSVKGNLINSKVNMTNGGENNNNTNAEKSVVKSGGRGRGGRGRGGRGRGKGKGLSIQKYSNSVKGNVINSKVNMTNGGTDNNNSNAEKSIIGWGGRRGWGGWGESGDWEESEGWGGRGRGGRGRGGRGRGVSVQKYSNSLKGSVINSKVNMTNGGTGNNNSNAEKSVIGSGGRGCRGRGRGRGGRGRHSGFEAQNYSNKLEGSVVNSQVNMSNGGENNDNSNVEDSYVGGWDGSHLLGMFD